MGQAFLPSSGVVLDFPLTLLHKSYIIEPAYRGGNSVLIKKTDLPQLFTSGCYAVNYSACSFWPVDLPTAPNDSDFVESNFNYHIYSGTVFIRDGEVVDCKGVMQYHTYSPGSYSHYRALDEHEVTASIGSHYYDHGGQYEGLLITLNGTVDDIGPLMNVHVIKLHD